MTGDHATQANHRGSGLTCLWVLLTVNAAVYLIIAVISLHSFRYETPHGERPLLSVLALMAVAFVPALLALWLALKQHPGGRLVACIWTGAVVYRLILLPSPPIQEIDFYRYIWDGITIQQGVSPYRFPPAAVLDAVRAPREATDPALAQLADFAIENSSVRTILERIGYSELPTVYPPVSQAVFASAVAITPPLASPRGYILSMKCLIVAFDLATLAAIAWILRMTGVHIGWALAYGWSPLILKEFANTGHLDSIAVCCSIVALGCYVRARLTNPTGWKRWLTCAALALGAGVGAKLYPIVFAPLLAIDAWKRFGGLATIGCGVIVVGISAICVWPMLPRGSAAASNGGHLPPLPEQTSSAESTTILPPPPPGGVPVKRPEARQALPRVIQEHDPGAGLQEFLRRWEINDLLFMVTYENLRPPGLDRARPWFAIVPLAWTQPTVAWLERRLTFPSRSSAAFAVARILTLAIWTAIALTIAFRVAKAETDVRQWLQAAFLSVAWFWLLAPTQNPWYWSWALPLLPFARCVTWQAVAPLTILYYLRFWFVYHMPDANVLGTPYRGEDFFHFVIVWCEFGPLLLALSLEGLWRWRSRRSKDARKSS